MGVLCVMMLTGMPYALGMRRLCSGTCTLEGPTFPAITLPKEQGILGAMRICLSESHDSLSSPYFRYLGTCNTLLKWPQAGLECLHKLLPQHIF